MIIQCLAFNLQSGDIKVSWVLTLLIRELACRQLLSYFCCEMTQQGTGCGDDSSLRCSCCRGNDAWCANQGCAGADGQQRKGVPPSMYCNSASRLAICCASFACMRERPPKPVRSVRTWLLEEQRYQGHRPACIRGSTINHACEANRRDPLPASSWGGRHSVMARAIGCPLPSSRLPDPLACSTPAQPPHAGSGTASQRGTAPIP